MGMKIFEQWKNKKSEQVINNKEHLEKAGGVDFEVVIDPETGEQKQFVNFFGTKIETDITDPEEFKRIKESVHFSELDEKIFSKLAQSYNLGHSMMFEGDPGAGKTFAHNKFNQFLHGEESKILTLTCTPKMSELEIIGHWMPKAGGRNSSDEKVKSTYERYDKVKQEYDDIILRTNENPDDKYLNDLEKASARLKSELDILQAETSGQVEWEFKKGKLIEAYVGNGGKGNMLLIDEFNVLPSNVQQIFLQTIADEAKLAQYISNDSNSEQSVYFKGKNTYISYAQNFPEKTRGRNVVAAPMTDRLNWFTIPQELVDKKRREFILNLRGRGEKISGKRTPNVSLHEQSWAGLESLGNGGFSDVSLQVLATFDQSYIHLIEQKPDKLGNQERSQQLENSTRRAIHTYNYLEQNLIRGTGGIIDLEESLRNAIIENYIDRIYDKELRGILLGELEQFITGKEFGMVSFDGKNMTAHEALGILKERVAKEEWMREADVSLEEEQQFSNNDLEMANLEKFQVFDTLKSTLEQNIIRYESMVEQVCTLENSAQ